MKNQTQVLKKPTCLSCTHWNKIYTEFPIIIEKGETPPEILSKIPKGKTAELSDGKTMQFVEFYCKIGHTKAKGSNCKNFKKDPNVTEE